MNKSNCFAPRRGRLARRKINVFVPAEHLLPANGQGETSGERNIAAVRRPRQDGDGLSRKTPKGGKQAPELPLRLILRGDGGLSRFHGSDPRRRAETARSACERLSRQPEQGNLPAGSVPMAVVSGVRSGRAQSVATATTRLAWVRGRGSAGWARPGDVASHRTESLGRGATPYRPNVLRESRKPVPLGQDRVQG